MPHHRCPAHVELSLQIVSLQIRRVASEHKVATQCKVAKHCGPGTLELLLRPLSILRVSLLRYRFS